MLPEVKPRGTLKGQGVKHFVILLIQKGKQNMIEVFV